MSGSFSQYRDSNFNNLYRQLLVNLFHDGQRVDVGQWQSQDVKERPEMVSIELTGISLLWPMASTMRGLQDEIKPNLPWAEDHFQERVSGQPLNPPPSEAWWPFAVKGNSEHKDGERFSHTYPERFWPKEAGHTSTDKAMHRVTNRGIRFVYGDLTDLVLLLERHPLTRQAYLPVWFPEDTGVVHGERVPCTLGYQFLVRGEQMHLIYNIRSCDLLRHFRDDVYMAARLCQWIIQQLGWDDEVNEVYPGNLVMCIGSLHVFEGDRARLTEEVRGGPS